jgi:DNA (cytosine-5)-methyltransferase 1
LACNTGPNGHDAGNFACNQAVDAGHVLPVAQPIPFDTTQITSPSNYSNPKPGDPCHPLAAGAHPPAVAHPTVLMDQGGSVMNVLEDGTVGTLRRETHGHEPCIVHGAAHPIGLDEEQNAMVDCFGTLKARTEGGGFEGSVMQTNMAVRRLTPTECERLQGFPDGYTDIQPNGKPTPDGPRYKALGNSWAVPVVTWLGSRIGRAS